MTYLALFAFITFASANFDLYRTMGKRSNIGSPWANNPNGYMTFNANPECGDIQRDNQFWTLRDDVSGNKLGVRCKGKCELNDVSSSSVL